MLDQFQFRSNDLIGRLSALLFMFHGDADTTIPCELGPALFAAAPGQKEILSVPGKGHGAICAPST